MTARNRGLDSDRTIALLRTPRSAELKHVSRSEASSGAETQRGLRSWGLSVSRELRHEPRIYLGYVGALLCDVLVDKVLG
jgi:hypothetical protein